MLYQASTLRPMINMREFPEHVVIYTMRRDTVSTGIVDITYQGDFEAGVTENVPLEHTREILITGSSSEFTFLAYEYVIPLWNLVDSHGRRGTTGGFNVRVRSAFRQGGTDYRERDLSFWLTFPIDGGGIIRFAGSPMDIANPTLNPRAPLPVEGPSDEELRAEMHDDGQWTRPSIENLRIAYNRVHQLATPRQVSAAEARRASRIANFDLQETAAAGVQSRRAEEADREVQGRVLEKIDEKKQGLPRRPRFDREDPV